MKTKRFLSSLGLWLAFAAFVTTLSLYGCSNDDEDVFMEEDVILEQTDAYCKSIVAGFYNHETLGKGEMEGEGGVLRYDSNNDQWVFIHNGNYPGDAPEGNYIWYDMPSKYEKYVDKEVLISGSYKYDYSIEYYPQPGEQCYYSSIVMYFKMNVKKITLAE